MTKVHFFTLLFLCFAVINGLAQQPFNNCSAVFLNNQMVVDEYSTTGKCKLSHTASGTLTVCTAELTADKGIPRLPLKFMIAIRDGNTGTMMMFSDKSYKKIDLKSVLAKCKVGDKIVLMTLKDEYALPHNEITVE